MSMRPIIRPEAPRWARALARTTSSTADAIGWLAIIAVLLLPGAAVIAAVAAAAPLVAAMFTAAFVALVASLIEVRTHVVSGPKWEIEGKPIDGQGFQLLADIDSRFAYAEKNVKELPTGISWPEVDADVRALLWEAAEHGAQVTSLDAEIHEMRYAEDGTPQAAMVHSLQQQREAHWQIMRGIQWEAETLARTAGNAVAAAHLALARTGSLAALERITPSRRAIIAAGALADARQRLELLASVWSELDESGAITAEKLDHDRKELDRERRQLGDGS